MREEIEAARLRPSMWGLDGSFSEYVAFLIGLNAGVNGTLLDGFGEWVAGRSKKGGATLLWPILVLRESSAKELQSNDWHNLEAADDARAVEVLFHLLTEFEADVAG
ncbi:hypothetical protein ACQEVM_36985 [Streptomyces sp. CA-243310]|uniref:hypothetical protein n=1 Tax=unclassified Streptomyces TaxID=2593676 RepID=UPI003323C440